MRKPLLILSLAGLLTAAFVAPAAAAKPASPGANRPTIVSVAIDLNTSGATAGAFDTLIAAVVECDLAGALSGTSQLTVFAPTDDAFAALGITPATFASDCPAGVTDILLYHVAPGRWSADRIIENDGGQLPTLNSDPLDVTIDGGVFIDQAQVIAADVNSSNGFIHAIDAVLLPGS
jgi:uncharacterized surface protein with fasciclin (FAS1) repeats